MLVVTTRVVGRDWSEFFVRCGIGLNQKRFACKDDPLLSRQMLAHKDGKVDVFISPTQGVNISPMTLRNPIRVWKE